jgi:hypothetical protein
VDDLWLCVDAAAALIRSREGASPAFLQAVYQISPTHHEVLVIIGLFLAVPSGPDRQ